MQQEILSIKTDKHQDDIKMLNSQLTAALSEKKQEIARRTELELNYKNKITDLEKELIKIKDEDEIFKKMQELENATKKLDSMTEELQKALDIKDQEMEDFLKLKMEIEHKLVISQKEVLFYIASF